MLIRPSGFNNGFIRLPEALLYPDSSFPLLLLGTIRVAQPW